MKPAIMGRRLTVKLERLDDEETGGDGDWDLGPDSMMDADIIIKDEPVEPAAVKKKTPAAKRMPRLKHRIPVISSQFECSICKARFDTLAQWNNHLRNSAVTHHDTPVRKCSLCQRQMRGTDLDFRAHWKVHETRRLYPCPHCDKRFTVRKYVSRHIYACHRPERPFSCPVCDKTFKQKGQMKLHHMTHTGEKPEACQYCEKTFRCKYSLICHERTHTGERPFACQEPGCNYRACDGSSLRYHKRNVHGGERLYQCPQCSKMFMKPFEVRQHVRKVHEKERTFPCDLCGKKFFSRCIMMKHRRLHSEDRQFKCGLCDARFKSQSTLTHHIRTHSEECTEKCPICGRLFKFVQYLKKHMETHNTAKIFKCECGKRFKSTRDLNRHMLRCGRKFRPHGCPYCTKRFSTRFSSKKHVLRFHTRIPSIWCLECGTEFKRAALFVAHYELRHEGAGPFTCPDCGHTVDAAAEFARHRVDMHMGFTTDGAAPPADDDVTAADIDGAPDDDIDGASQTGISLRRGRTTKTGQRQTRKVSYVEDEEESDPDSSSDAEPELRETCGRLSAVRRHLQRAAPLRQTEAQQLVSRQRAAQDRAARQDAREAGAQAKPAQKPAGKQKGTTARKKQTSKDLQSAKVSLSESVNKPPKRRGRPPKNKLNKTTPEAHAKAIGATADELESEPAGEFPGCVMGTPPVDSAVAPSSGDDTATASIAAVQPAGAEELNNVGQRVANAAVTGPIERLVSGLNEYILKTESIRNNTMDSTFNASLMSVIDTSAVLDIDPALAAVLNSAMESAAESSDTETQVTVATVLNPALHHPDVCCGVDRRTHSEPELDPHPSETENTTPIESVADSVLQPCDASPDGERQTRSEPAPEPPVDDASPSDFTNTASSSEVRGENSV